MLGLPEVTVWITTYNHEMFIAQALDSVLMQQTNFDFDIIIGEDCSKDKTREIVVSYAEKYPGKIKLFLPQQNLGCNQMFHATYPLCKGKYIAWLDGDDYWLDPCKLQKQYDLLQANPDIVFCFHRVKVVDEHDNFMEISSQPSREEDDTLETRHFLEELNPVNTPSFFHKNVLGEQLPQWFYKISLVDLAFYFLLLEHGKGKYQDDVMAAYRLHSGGAWTGASLYSQHLKLAEFYETIQPFLPTDYNAVIDVFRCEHSYLLLEYEVLNGNYKKARKYFDFLRSKKFEGLSRRKLWMTKLLLKYLLKRFRKPVSI